MLGEDLEALEALEAAKQSAAANPQLSEAFELLSAALDGQGD